jgi:hypothetical protein
MSKNFGSLPNKFNFSLNPYPDLRFSKCPDCGIKTGQRKVAIFIHVSPLNPIILNYTNRYCSNCDILIGHKHEIEHHLTELFKGTNPTVIGNDYLLVGTVERKIWKDNIKYSHDINKMRDFIQDFKSFQVIQMTSEGWFQKGQKPPLRIAPASTEWRKNKK